MRKCQLRPNNNTHDFFNDNVININLRLLDIKACINVLKLEQTKEQG
jgi:hypothetical protein